MSQVWTAKKLNFNIKDKLINLAGKCFWYWDTFYSFLESCGVSSSIYRRFSKEGGKYQLMRSILELLDSQERHDVIRNIIIQFYNFKPSEDGVDKDKAEQLLIEFRNIVGPSLLEEEADKKEIERKTEEQKRIIEEKKLLQKKLEDNKESFLNLTASSNKQQRGFDLETLFFDLLEMEEFEVHRPYKIKGEQIDGYFKYEKFDYIVEIKWTDELVNQSDLSIFDGKIRGKGQSTRGFCFSINGFDSNAVTKASGHEPRIILMDGSDFFSILEERVSFYDLMKLKTDALARKGDIYVKFNGS
jgi:hypothetical protein